MEESNDVRQREILDQISSWKRMQKRTFLFVFMLALVILIVSILSDPIRDDYTAQALAICFILFVPSFIQFFALGKKHNQYQKEFDFAYLSILFVVIVQWNQMIKERRAIRLTDAVNESWARGYFPAFSILVGGARMGSFFITLNLLYSVSVFLAEETWDHGILPALVLLLDQFLISVALISYHLLMEHVCEKLVRSFLEVSSAKKEQSNFLEKMSHHIRTPLNGVIGFIDEIKANPNRDSPLFDEQLRMAEVSAQNLENLASKLWRVSLTRENKLSLFLDTVDLNKAVPEWEKKIRGMANEKRINLDFAFSFASTKRVIMDSSQFQEILLGLVNNAIKFTPPYGKVQVLLNCSDEDERVRLSFRISDTGRGIPQHLLNRLFEQFFHCAEEDICNGSGVGLFLTKKLVTLMGGEIFCETYSNFYRTVFFGYVFVSKAREISSPNNNQFCCSHSIRALIAEDNEINLKLILQMMKDFRISCLTAQNGKEAVQLYQQNEESIDIVLMDIRMPEMDGIEASKRIKKMQEISGRMVPILAVTAGVTMGEIERLNSVGISFISKPIRKGELKKRICECLGRELDV